MNLSRGNVSCLRRRGADHPKKARRVEKTFAIRSAATLTAPKEASTMSTNQGNTPVLDLLTDMTTASMESRISTRRR